MVFFSVISLGVVADFSKSWEVVSAASDTRRNERLPMSQPPCCFLAGASGVVREDLIRCSFSARPRCST